MRMTKTIHRILNCNACLLYIRYLQDLITLMPHFNTERKPYTFCLLTKIYKAHQPTYKLEVRNVFNENFSENMKSK